MKKKTILLVLLTALAAGCAVKVGKKTLKLSFEDSLQSYDDQILKSTVWEVKGMATDKKDVKYYVYTSKDYVIYIHPYKKLVYSREGNVIGFVDTEKIIRLHDPFEGWGGIDRTPVGIIRNPYEGKYLPDLSTFKTPTTRVSE